VTCQRALELDVAAFLVEPGRPEWASFRDHYPGCPDCAATIAAWSRLEQSLRTPPTGRVEGHGGPAHPAPALLARYAEAPASLGTEAPAVSSHLESCVTCRTEVLALQRFDWRRASEPTPQRNAITERGLEPQRLGERIANWFGFESPLALVPIAAAIVLLVGFGVWMASRGGQALAPSSLPPTAEAPAAEPQPPATGTGVIPPDDTRELREERGIAAVEGSESAPGSAAGSDVSPSGATPELHAPAAVVAEEKAKARDAAPTPTTPGLAPAPRQETQPASEQILIAAVASLPPPSYTLPPGAEALGWQREFGAVRSGASDAARVRVEAQAPHHVGQTATAAPRLWWSLDAPTDRALVFTLSNDRDIDPALRVELPGPHASGLASVDLARFGVSLEPGVVYRWYVTVVVDPERPSINPTSSAAIERLGSGDPRLAGLWYDAYDFFAGLAAAHPELEALQRHRNTLMQLARASD
jgi:hypothetical protein